MTRKDAQPPAITELLQLTTTSRSRRNKTLEQRIADTVAAAEIRNLHKERAEFEASFPKVEVQLTYLIYQLGMHKVIFTDAAFTQLFGHLVNQDPEKLLALRERLVQRYQLSKGEYLGFNKQIVDDTELYVDLIKYVMSGQSFMVSSAVFFEALYAQGKSESRVSTDDALRTEFPWSIYFLLYIVTCLPFDFELSSYVVSKKDGSLSFRPEKFKDLLLLIQDKYTSLKIVSKRTALFDYDFSWLCRQYLKYKDSNTALINFFSTILKPIPGVQLEPNLETAVLTNTGSTLTVTPKQQIDPNRQWNNTPPAALSGVEKTTSVAEPQSVEHAPNFPYKQFEATVALYAALLYQSREDELSSELLGAIFTIAGPYLNETIDPAVVTTEFENYIATYFADGISEESIFDFMEEYPFVSAGTISFLEIFGQV